MRAERGTIAIHFVQEAVQCLRARGLAVEPFLARAGIPPEFLAQPLTRVSPAQFGHLWRDIAAALDDEFFGLDSHPARAGTYALMCASVLPCTSLGQALRRILRFMHLVLDDLRAELVVEGGTAHIRLHDLRHDGRPDRVRQGLRERGPQGRAGAQRLFAYATFFIMVYGLACWLVRRRIPLLRGQFQCPEPPPQGEAQFTGEYRVLFCEALSFDAPVSSLSFAASNLALAPAQNANSLREYLRGAPANFLVKYRNPRSLAARIRRRLREQHPADWPTFGQLCEAWHYTEATLRRHLHDEGHTYQSLKDDLRRDMAIALLQDGQQPLPDIAAALGFTEPSGFHRAFKKWTGARPSDYRPAA